MNKFTPQTMKNEYGTSPEPGDIYRQPGKRRGYVGAGRDKCGVPRVKCQVRRSTCVVHFSHLTASGSQITNHPINFHVALTIRKFLLDKV